MADLEVSKGTAVSVEQAQQWMFKRVETAFQKAMMRLEAEAAPERAELTGYWNVWAVGPWQPAAPQPSQMIKIGELARIYTVVWLNPNYELPGPTTACTLLSNLADKFEIKYATGNLNTWALGPGPLNVQHSVDVVSNQCWYVDVLEFTAQPGWEGLYEMNISVRVRGANPDQVPPFAGYATAIRDIDPDLFYPPAGPPPRGPHWHFDIPCRFMIYP